MKFGLFLRTVKYDNNAVTRASNYFHVHSSTTVMLLFKRELPVIIEPLVWKPMQSKKTLRNRTRLLPENTEWLSISTRVLLQAYHRLYQTDWCWRVWSENKYNRKHNKSINIYSLKFTTGLEYFNLIMNEQHDSDFLLILVNNRTINCQTD